MKFNEFRQNVVVSRKATLASMDKNRQEMMENIEVGKPGPSLNLIVIK